MSRRTRYEQETILNYNQETKTATCYTCDPAMIRKLDKLCAEDKAITVVEESEGSKTYKFPKNWIKIRKSKQLTDEQRSELVERMRTMRQKGDN